MRRAKRHKVKEERPETSTAQLRDKEEHDLAYYIHDRVELMHQVFSVLKYKELRAMAPECVRHISADDLQELCTEELLGISSKRLCAILDGAEPPSDTESSSRSPSPQNLETISLDSISSDEEILSEASSKKKKHKHRHRESKDKRAKTKEKKKTKAPEEITEQSRASRAGLTVLELLELQARARAIRAQLQQEQQHKATSETPVPGSSHHSSDGEVEIKEEPAEVVEISSDEEKPNVQELEKAIQPQPAEPSQDAATLTKRINDHIVTVPVSKPARKIKLNRNKVTVTTPAVETNNSIVETTAKPTTDNKNDTETTKATEKPKPKEKTKKKKKLKKKVEKEGSDHDEITLQLSDSEKMDLLEDLERKSNASSVDSDSSSDSESDSDKEKGGEVDSEAVLPETKETEAKLTEVNAKQVVKSSVTVIKPPTTLKSVVTTSNGSKVIDKSVSEGESSKRTLKSVVSCPNDDDSSLLDTPAVLTEEITPKTTIIVTITQDKLHSNTTVTKTVTEQRAEEIDLKDSEQNSVGSTKNDDVIKNTSIVENNVTKTMEIESENPENQKEVTGQPNLNFEPEKISTNTEKDTDLEQNVSESVPNSMITSEDEPKNESLDNEPEKAIEINNEPVLETNNESPSKEVSTESELEKQRTESEKDLSEGELSDRESSEVETVELRPEVVCISDDENPTGHKKKKKEKKSKKVKKSKKKKSDFREGADENFYKDSDKLANDSASDIDNIKEVNISTENVEVQVEEAINVEGNQVILDIETDDDVYEILELSDDSSCYEVEGTVLSKEPTAEEIEALSAKIDEINDIERAEIITEEEIKEYERKQKEKREKQEMEVIEKISWKDRYLDSKKVKRVLSTSNILNALRKKNRDLKKKLDESKKETVVEKEVETEIESEKVVLEGSIDQYNTLEALTQYIDPVKELTETETQGDTKVTREMKKDAKQLLKMYKRLLKYNDINKGTEKDPKKKKKKKKKEKKKCENSEKVVVS